MTEYEKRDQFYQQFNTVRDNWEKWRQTPEATMEILKHPWKAEPPDVIVRAHDPDTQRTREILNKIRTRHAAAGTYTGLDNGQTQ